MKKERIKSIDGLRGFSCIIIAFFSHYYRFWGSIGIVFNPELFVEVFVAISGFTMAYNYKNSVQNEGFFKYFLKRYLKIMPMFWIADIAMVFFLNLCAGGYKVEHPFIGGLWKEFSGLWCGWFENRGHAMGAMWTIDILMLCYIGFYVLCKFRKYMGNAVYVGVIVCIMEFSLYAMTFWWEKPFFYYTTSLRVYGGFCCGLLLYELYARISVKRLDWVSGVAVGLWAAETIFYLWIRGRLIYFNAIMILCPICILLSVFCKPVKRLFEGYLFQTLGKLSFSIYLWHGIPQTIIYLSPLKDTFSGLVIFVILTFLIAYLSKEYLEKNAVGIKIKISGLLNKMKKVMVE